MAKIIEKLFYMVELELSSPLSIGNGDNIYSDHDVILGSDGKPYIPATAIAGCLVHYLDKNQRHVFLPKYNNDDYLMSPYFISNGEIEGLYSISIRDGIKLNEDKVSEDGNKYDYQVINTGAKFIFRIEVTIRENNNVEDMKKIVDTLLSGMNNGEIRLGYKVTRGLGKLKLNNIYVKSFENNMSGLLDFDIYDKTQYDSYNFNTETSVKYNTVEVTLKQIGGISIRNYSINASDKESVDFEHIKCNGTPIIPGTSWNGLIRGRMQYYVKLLELNEQIINLNRIFGTVDPSNNTSIPSSIVIDESIINGGKELCIYRNKIDRFSGGAQERALFNEYAHYNGNTKLTIRIRKDIYDVDSILGLLALTIKDIENGFIAIGGQTNIGRGIFEVKEVLLDGSSYDMKSYIKKLAKCKESA